MQDLNAVQLLGNLTREPERREGTSADGNAWIAAGVGIAVQGRGDDEVHFFDVVGWGPTAEYMMRNCQKGRRVALTGRLQQRRWTAEEGDNRSRVEVVVDDLWFLGPRKDGKPDDAQAGPPSS